MIGVFVFKIFGFNDFLLLLSFINVLLLCNLNNFVFFYFSERNSIDRLYTDATLSCVSLYTKNILPFNIIV